MTQPLSPCPTCNKRRWWYRSKAGLVPMCPTRATKGRCPALVYQNGTCRKKLRRSAPPAPPPARVEVQPAAPRHDVERLKATCPVCGDPCAGVCASCTARGLR